MPQICVSALDSILSSCVCNIQLEPSGSLFRKYKRSHESRSGHPPQILSLKPIALITFIDSSETFTTCLCGIRNVLEKQYSRFGSLLSCTNGCTVTFGAEWFATVFSNENDLGLESMGKCNRRLQTQPSSPQCLCNLGW